MTAVLINPKLLVNKFDKFTTGIVYMPINLAYINSSLKKNNINTKIIDLFGSNPKQAKINTSKIEIGEDIDIAMKNIETEISKNNQGIVFFLYANQIINHDSVIDIIRYLKKNYSSNKLVLVENTQAVTAYSLRKIKDIFFKAGVDIILCGDAEKKSVEIYEALKNNTDISVINNIITPNFDNKKNDNIENIDHINFPDWSDFNLKNYWKILHAHGPFSSNKYLPILTSRGCPYPCKFCVIPETTYRRWRGRSSKNIVDEIEYYMKKYNVLEFHLEDLNPTVNEKRILEFCHEILKRKIKISWKIVSGTKVESIKNLETIKLMSQSGCKYISISPESGSARLMKLIDKPFDLNHAEKLIHQMNLYNIKSQACFVLGFPGENNNDRELTKEMVLQLTKKGLDEIAVFIITPIPGSKIFDQFSGYDSFSDLNFSPTWRNDYKNLNRFRIKLYRIFLLTKLRFYPKKIFKQILNFFTLNFQTKMEMVPFKALRLTILHFKLLWKN